MQDDKELEVEPRVFDLIVYLITNSDIVVTRHELFQKVWQGRNVLDATLSNHIKIARQVLGDDGQAQHTIKTIHGRGYQFIAKITEHNKQKQSSPRSVVKNKVFALLSIGLGLVLILALYFLSQYFLRAKTVDEIPVIAVLPFTNNHSDATDDYFSIAIADQIIGHLNYLQNISVRPTASIRKFINATDPLEIGKQLEVDFILTGNYLKVKNTIRLNIELVKINNSQLVWRSKQIEVENKNAFELQDIVAQRVINALKIKFSSTELQRIEKDIPNNPLAYEYYLRGVAYPLTSDGNKLAIQMLKKSLELDENYALTYVQLGDRIRRYKQFSLHDLPFQNAENYYQKALNLNPELLSALSNLALLYTETNRLEQAIELVQKMANINPNHADTHFAMGYIYRYVGLNDQSIAEMEKAVKLDSHNQKYRSLIGTYSNAGMYHKAINMANLYPKSPFTLGWKGLLNRRLGNNKAALDYFNQVLESDESGLWTNVATVFKSHMMQQPKKGLQAVEKLANSAESDGETLYYLASYYALLGDYDNAIISLEKAINAGYYNYPFMASNDYFENILTDERFKKLLKLAQTKHLDYKEVLSTNKHKI